MVAVACGLASCSPFTPRYATPANTQSDPATLAPTIAVQSYPGPTQAPKPPDFYFLPPDWHNPIRLQLGETAILHHGGLRITFVEVVADTRCSEPTCQAKGNAQVRLYVERVDAAGLDMVLNTRPDLAVEPWYIGYAIKLMAVEPDLARTPQPAKADYVVLLQVTLI